MSRTMPPLTTDALRSAFLEFFQERQHLLMPSSSLVPAGDPTLLLTSAGMVPFKPYFTGEEEPPNRRLTSVQKCFRATDIDSVGDPTHLTFFEMLGNFSIGSYFKKEAISWAWEFVTVNLQLPPERLWITIFLDDDEAFNIWKDIIGVPENRIVRLNEDNFWGPAGSEGPCGPCSEIHYDLDPERGLNDEKPGGDNSRFLEIWNLVFMQYFQNGDGERSPLPSPNIDTGMGLERTVAILQGVGSVYETDLLGPMVAHVAALCDVPYGTEEQSDYAIRVVTEHGRSATFLIADGVVPSNEGRGYVLRRIIRRALRYARKLGMSGEFMAKVAEFVIERMQLTYPGLAENRPFILKTLQSEEQRFAQALSDGSPLLEEILQVHRRVSEIVGRVSGLRGRQPFDPLTPQNAAKAIDEIKIDERITGIVSILEQLFATTRRLVLVSDSKGSLARAARTIPGKASFYLYDTHGFPLELTQQIAEENGFEVDEKGFHEEMESQRDRGRASSRFMQDDDFGFSYDDLKAEKTIFLGYQQFHVDTFVVGLISGGQSLDSCSASQEIEVILPETPFYAEGGGQMGDTGEIYCENGTIRVNDTQLVGGKFIVHYGTVTQGSIKVGDKIRAAIDVERRVDIMRNHSATHLLHQALRTVLGAHVRQSGSLVAPEYLRFDFTHIGSVTREELFRIQDIVNGVIRSNLSADKRETTYRQATSGGALAFFGERYPDVVRVLAIGDFSYEVCGGTHIDRTGDIGTFRIITESGIGSGIRRIEAVSGRGADVWIDERISWLDEISERLQVRPFEMPQRISNLLNELDSSRKLVSTSRRDASLKQVETLLEKKQTIGAYAVVASEVFVDDLESMREMGDWIRDKIKTGMVILGVVLDGRPSLLVMVTPDLVTKGIDARDVVKVAAEVIGGGGGGKPELAQAGGRDSSNLPKALEAAIEFAQGKLV